MGHAAAPQPFDRQRADLLAFQRALELSRP
jgi:hypothetical protein